MSRRPLLVARAPRRSTGGELVRDPYSVGVLRVSGQAPPGEIRPEAIEGLPTWLVVVVVVAVPAEGRERSSSIPPPITPGDLVPWRPTTDVVLLGSTGPGPVTVELGEHRRRLTTAAAVGTISLRTGLMTHDGLPLVPAAPAPPELVAGTRWFDPGDERHQAAPPALRFPAVRGDELVRVATPDATTEVQLPGLAPRLRVVSAMHDLPDQELVAFLDGIVVDVSAGTARLAYRALVPITRDDARDVDRVDVVLAPVDALLDPFPDHDVPRAEIGPAWELEHAETGEAPPPLDGHDLQIARYETWDGSSPLPVLPLHEAAALSAELTEQRDPRDQVLARRRLDGYGWELEERAWAEAMSVTPRDEDEVTLAHLWGHAFQTAQDALERPEEADISADDYARVVVALEGTHPEDALRDHGMGLGTFQRLDRRMQRRAAEDAAFARELEGLLDEHRARTRARHGAEPGRELPLDEEEST